MPTLKEHLGAGVITGNKVLDLFTAAKKHGFAIPAVNVTSSSTANAVMEAAAKLNSPIIIQVSNGGAAFFAGKSISNAEQKASVLGATAAAFHVRQMAEHYGIPVVLHSDHCAKKLLPWFDGMLEADEKYYKEHGEPLFSSHMLDLSEEKDEENIATCEKYFERMAKMKMWLEMEIGITGGEEDGVDNTRADQSRLYTQPEQIWSVYQSLSAISPNFSIAAAFGNVHGVYKPGNVKLNPGILGTHQEFVKDKLSASEDKPCFFVFHGGSGSTKDEIKEAVGCGVVKMNVDTDTQWAFWNGVREFYKAKEGYLQSQIGNPDGEDKPNKGFYDPRVWLRKAEESMRERVAEACRDLGNVDTLRLEI